MRMNRLIGLNFMWNGMIITMLLIMAFCFKSFTKRYIFHVLMRLVKVVILTTGTFPAYEASTYFSFLLNHNILSPKCFKEDLTYILDILTLFAYILRIKIKNKCENQNDLDLFLNGSNFIQNGIYNYFYAAHKGNFFYMLLTRRYTFQLTKYEHEGV